MLEHSRLLHGPLLPIFRRSGVRVSEYAIVPGLVGGIRIGMPAIRIIASSNRYAANIAHVHTGLSPASLRQPQPVHHSLYTLVTSYRLILIMLLPYHPLHHIVRIARAAHALVAQQAAPQAHKSTASRHNVGSSLTSRFISIKRLPPSSVNSSSNPSAATSTLASLSLCKDATLHSYAHA